jgi:hypothetical protein
VGLETDGAGALTRDEADIGIESVATEVSRRRRHEPWQMGVGYKLSRKDWRHVASKQG